MRFGSAAKGSAVVAIVIALAVAATAGRSSAEDPGSGAVLKARIAELRAEVARLRAGEGVPDGERPAARSRETLSPGSERRVELALPFEETRTLLRSRNRAEQGLGLKMLGSLAVRDEKLALLRETLQGADAGMKSRALSLLKTVGGGDSVALAAGVLQEDGPSWLRSQAASVLGGLGDPAALSPLLDASRTDDLQVRSGAVVALDQLGLPGPLQELIETLAGKLDHPDGRMREDAVDMLSTFRMPAVVPALAKALGDRTNSRVREAAADGLGQTGLAAAIPSLQEALNDSDSRVRLAAQHALDALGAARK